MKTPIIISAFVVAAGIASAQDYPPSQRELNGFVLHQYKESVAANMGEFIKEVGRDDGWIDRAYWLDENHTSYMVFGFPESELRCESIQITGLPDTPMLPFLGFVLGDRRDSVTAVLGRPSQIKHFDDVDVDLYSYEGRNYTLEFDSHDRLYSIRIMGQTGFPTPSIADTSIRLEGIRSILRSQDPRQILELLSGDIEIFFSKSDSLLTFRQNARAEIVDTESSISKVLYSGESSVSHLLTDSTISQAEQNLRLLENKGAGIVYKFTPSTGLEEIVLFRDTGKFRIWEITLSR